MKFIFKCGTIILEGQVTRREQLFMIEKNQEYDVEILDHGMEGEGIAKIEGYTMFVKGALKGETAKIKVLKANKDYGFGKLIEIKKTAKHREEPICPSFGKCGGCHLQHMNYEAQLDFKTNLVKNTLKKQLGYEVSVEPIIGMGIPYHYRNKVQYPVVNGKIGFYAGRTHAVVENKECYIQNQKADKLAKNVFEIMKANGISTYDEKTGKGLLRHIIVRIAIHNNDQMMLVLVTNHEKIENEKKILKEILSNYPEVKTIIQNINTRKDNVILGEKCITLYGEGYIEDYLGDYKFKISPLSFYQVNPVQTEILYNVAKDFAELTGKENVFDLYCGIGTISIFVADKAKNVFGVEVVEQAIIDAKENAEMNEKKNIEFICGKAEEIIPQKYQEGKIADVVFVDPPRKGCDEKLLETLKEMKARKIVYISCNPATLARDLKYLTENGYEIEKVQPVDMFPETNHCECICALKRI